MHPARSISFDHQTLEELVNILQHEKTSALRHEAARALSRINDDRARQALIGALKDEDLLTFQAAAEGLARSGDERAVKALILAVREPVDRKRAYAAIPSLIQAFALEDSSCRESLEEVLTQFGDLVVDPLIIALQDNKSDIRQGAIRVLSTIGSIAAEKFIDRRLPLDVSGRYQVPPESAIRHNKIVKLLLTALNDRDYRVRQAAANALGKVYGSSLHSFIPGGGINIDNQRALKVDKAVQALVTVVEKRNEPARQAAAGALLKLANDTKSIIRALESDNPYARQAMIRAIDRYFAGISFAESGISFPGWFEILKVEDEMEVHNSSKEIIDKLAEKTRDSELDIRMASLSALKTIRAKIQQKRVEGVPDIIFKAAGLPKYEVHEELNIERKAVEVIQNAPPVEPQRYADFTFYSDESPQLRIPEGSTLQAEQVVQT